MSISGQSVGVPVTARQGDITNMKMFPELVLFYNLCHSREVPNIVTPHLYDLEL